MLGCMIPAAPETWSDYQSQIIADPALVAYFDFREGPVDQKQYLGCLKQCLQTANLAPGTTVTTWKL